MILIIFVTLALCAFRPASAATNAVTETQDAVKKSKETLASLYTIIRGIALPPPSAEATGEEPTKQRLVMLMPGKVPSYYDYFPDNSYEDNPEYNYTDQQVNIPPRVMENMFSLSDVIPGRYPLCGVDSGESMAVIYEDILNMMEVREKSQEDRERYATAIKFLTEKISDPLNVTASVTRIQLYKRGRQIYNKKKIEIQNTIDTMRRTRPGTEFERWFQRNYLILKSRVEGAYTEWVLIGYKGKVELFQSYLHAESPGADLERARMIFKASGFSSLDQTSTIYPVTFVPENWYRYLTHLNETEQMMQLESRDEILLKIGEFKAHKNILNALKAHGPSDELIMEFKALQASLENSTEELTASANNTEKLRQKCLLSRIIAKATNTSQDTDECEQYAAATGNAGEIIGAHSELFAYVKDLDYQINSFDLVCEEINKTIVEIEEQIAELEERLEEMDIKLSHLARAAQHALDMQDQVDSKWQFFTFDSSRQTSRSYTDYAAKVYQVAASGSVGGLLWRVHGFPSILLSISELSFKNAMNSANMLVSGELLRVTVQRPWFRPSIFKSKEFQIRHTAQISPGPLEGENDFIDAITEPGANYLLPEYVTGLLLSRNVDIEFRGISASYAIHAVRSAIISHSSGFAFWSGNTIAGPTKSKHRTFSAETTSDGLRISIPGPQIIGYYTEVVAEFPTQE